MSRSKERKGEHRWTDPNTTRIVDRREINNYKLKKIKLSKTKLAHMHCHCYVLIRAFETSKSG